MNCYICDGVAIGHCSMCTRAYCGVSVEGGLCKPCETLLLSSISDVGTGGPLSTEGMHARILRAAESNGIHPEHAPTLQQLEAFQARAAAWQQEHLNVQVQQVATDAAMTEVTQTNLQRVIPVGQTKTIRGGEMTLLSLELYDDALILHWWLRAATGHEPITEDQFHGVQDLEQEEQLRFIQSLTKHLVVTAKDDRGAVYKGGRGFASWRERDVDCRGDARLTPVVDARATRLTIRIEELVTHVVNGQPAILMDTDGRPFLPAIAPDIGPWEFEVAL